MNIKNLIYKSFKERDFLYNNPDTNSYRLFNSQGDGLKGLTIDIYGEYLLVQYFNESVNNLLSNDSVLKNSIIENAEKNGLKINGVLVKNRIKLKGRQDFNEIRKSRIIYGSMPRDNYFIKQNKIDIFVDLVNGQSTGVFLDMREMRNKLAEFYKLEKFHYMLNLFSYTSMFSIHALKNGIKHSINVDLSKTVLKKSVENYRLNNLNCDRRDFVYGDSIKWVKAFEKTGKDFSFVVFDPPTFSRNKVSTFSVKNNYSNSLQLIDNIVRDGYIFTSVNSAGVSKKEYISYHPGNWELVIYGNESSDFKFADVPYLKAGVWGKN